MQIIEQIGKTVDEAKELALQQLGLSDAQVEFEVLDEGNKGVFGLGTKFARVRVKVKGAAGDDVEKVIHTILKLMQINAIVEQETLNEQVRYNILGENLGILIGKRGQTLEALQFILNLIANKGLEQEQRTKIYLDIEDYRLRREKVLKELAFKMADKAKQEKRHIVLSPMLPNERRIIHTALKEDPSVVTYSEGQDPLRKVIIAPQKKGEKVEVKA